MPDGILGAWHHLVARPDVELACTAEIISGIRAPNSAKGR